MDTNTSGLAIRFHKKIAGIHLVGWLSYFGLFYWFSYQLSADMIQPFYRAGGFTTWHLLVFYSNLLLLQPALFEKRRYFAYAFSIIGLLILSAIYTRFIDQLTPPHNMREMMENAPKHIQEHFNRSGRPFRKGPPFFHARVFFGVLTTLPIFFVSTLIAYVQARRRREREAAEVKNRLLEAETSLLRFQINPHFLFNTLNNIYALSLLQSPRTPEAIQLLSEMLRYVTYNSTSERVTMEQEIRYIQSYIQLQLLKDDSIEHVKYDLDGASNNLLIAPMILIPFIENSFKHSKFEDVENGWINIKVYSNGQELHLEVSNSVLDEVHQKDQVGGVGLSNVRKRLALLYPEKHTLDITSTTDRFEVALTLTLDT